jgi:ATP-binding cassette subfamily B protein RaxB
MMAFLAYKEQFSTRTTALADIVLTEPEDPERGEPSLADEADDGPRAPAAIEVKGLRFRYSEHDPWVLDGVDLRVEPGESVAIVGASGCGKTTLLKILASLLAPSEGAVVVDGQPLKNLGVDRYRRMLGVVMQDDQLFAGSIAENIAFFAEHPDQERIEACARQAAVHDAIAAMPMGYATLIGDMGTALSGGQKQRILIARALYRRPAVLLLDEATSHLDVKRERDVNAAIERSNLTRIIVAHRPETILSADRVIVLAGGRVVDEARKGELGPERTRSGRAHPRFTPPSDATPSALPAAPAILDVAAEPDVNVTRKVGAFRELSTIRRTQKTRPHAPVQLAPRTQKLPAYRLPPPRLPPRRPSSSYRPPPMRDVLAEVRPPDAEPRPGQASGQ